MSDFLQAGWSAYITVITIVGLLACGVLLMVTSRYKLAPGADPTTGHVWDGDLRELNNPLPRWWMILFVLTLIFAGVYLALYPGLGTTKGVLGWTSAGEHAQEQAEAQADLKTVYSRFAAMPVEALAADLEAHGIGERLFINNCAACHGSDARGSKGYPNLTDSDWLGGDGGLDYIAKTITEGRQAQMPPMAAAVGTAEDLKNVAAYVLSLSGSAHNAVAAQLGKPKFAACAGCHGLDGKGNQALGAPNLTDKIWLHGWGEAAIISMVQNGKVNVMPAHASRLTPEQIRVLGAYVWGLSHPAVSGVPAHRPAG